MVAVATDLIRMTIDGAMIDSAHSNGTSLQSVKSFTGTYACVM